MSNDSPGRVTGIGGVFFRSDNKKASQDWYVEQFGFSSDHDGFVVMPWKNLDGSPASSVWSPFDRDTEYFGDSGQEYMINYRVDDLDALLTKLEAAGIEIIPKREDGELGRFAWIVDVDGRRVELWEPPEGM